jgi:transcriptional regulator with XRE-family HTH domain
LASVAYQRHRRDLAAALRQLRQATGLSQSTFAERLGWLQTRASKIETGKQFPTEDDIREWAVAANAEGETGRLLDMHRQATVEYVTWQDSYRAAGGAAGKQREIGALEAQATRIGKFEPAMVPSQLMTAGFAREFLRSPSGPASFGTTDAEIDDMVTARLARQSILYDSAKQVQIVILEAALYTRLCSPAAMAGQLDRLLASDGLPALELTIVPFTEFVPVYPLSGFVVYDDDLVLVETLAGEQRIYDPEAIARYAGWLDLLRETGVRGREAAGLIRRAMATLREGHQ